MSKILNKSKNKKYCKETINKQTSNHIQYKNENPPILMLKFLFPKSIISESLMSKSLVPNIPNFEVLILKSPLFQNSKSQKPPISKDLL